ncbi:MAG: alpha/beta hydrolase [Muribaculaceae bacterium]|nr:alpha/beta hydrolase [Muribaculaceae bacterium]
MKKLIFSLLLSGISLMAFAQSEEAETATSLSFLDADNAVVINKTDSAALVGTWLMPENATPKAAIVLATGSGLQDRDETVLNHRPFRAIAERLSKEGYAVLRLDDRGVGKSSGDVVNATTATLTGDIAAGLEWMDSVAPNIKKGVLGHSEGGLIAVNLAQNPKCDFIITLATPSYPGDSIILQQARAVTTAMMGRFEGEPMQKKLLSDQLGEQFNLPIVKKQVELQVETLLSPWYREFLRTDPTEAIRAVNKRWLALNGEKDYQVLAKNLAHIKEINYNAECMILPEHNHLFLECSTGLPQEYALLKGDISEETLKLIVDWLNSIFP